MASDTGLESLEGLDYIIKSPSHECGGFHPNAVITARWAYEEISSLRQRLSAAEADLDRLRHAAQTVDVSIVVDAERDKLRRELAEAEKERDELKIELAEDHEGRKDAIMWMQESFQMLKERDEARQAALWCFDSIADPHSSFDAEHRWPWLAAADTPRSSLPKPGETTP